MTQYWNDPDYTRSRINLFMFFIALWAVGAVSVYGYYGNWNATTHPIGTIIILYLYLAETQPWTHRQSKNGHSTHSSSDASSSAATQSDIE